VACDRCVTRCARPAAKGPQPCTPAGTAGNILHETTADPHGFWSIESAALLASLHSCIDRLSAADVAERLENHAARRSRPHSDGGRSRPTLSGRT
jgi:hypothetical protein